MAIAALLLASFLIPAEVYAPPHEEYHDGNYRVYQERPERTAVLLCRSTTREYYGYLINWSLGFPHDSFYSNAGMARTTIIVKNWTYFRGHHPLCCEILASAEQSSDYGDALYEASLILKNLTSGTGDYERLEPFFEFASYYPELPRTNNTRVNVIITTTDLTAVNRRPFLVVWVLVVVLSSIGLVVSRRRIYLTVFVVVLLLGALFLGRAIYWEHEDREYVNGVNYALSLKGSGGACWPVVGYVSIPPSKKNVKKALTLFNETGSKLIGVDFENSIVKLEVGVSPKRYDEFVKRVDELGWEGDFQSRREISNWLNDTLGELTSKEAEISTLEKYLPELPSRERKALESFLKSENESIATTKMNLEASKSCYEVDAVVPLRYRVHYYAPFSDLLAKLALLILGVALLIGGKDEG